MTCRNGADDLENNTSHLMTANHRCNVSCLYTDSYLLLYQGRSVCLSEGSWGELCPYFYHFNPSILSHHTKFASLQLLHIVQFLVVTVFGYQLIVLSALHYLAFVKHMYYVGVLYCGQAVCYGHGGAALH